MNISLALRRRRIQLLRSYMSTSKTKQKTLSPHCQIPHVFRCCAKIHFVDVGRYSTGDGEMGSDQNLHPRSINEATSRIYCRMGGTWTSLFRRSWLSNLALSTAIQLCRGTTWNLESFVIAEDVPVLANDCLPSEKFFVASKIVIGVTSPICFRSQRSSSRGCGHERKVRKLEYNKKVRKRLMWLHGKNFFRTPTWSG